ncbi:MAG: endolytic transglycosylase MltG [Rickettsiales bacterium]|nr:endolytic transglycosylase MltG [Rickettsiales bacterium]
MTKRIKILFGTMFSIGIIFLILITLYVNKFLNSVIIENKLIYVEKGSGLNILVNKLYKDKIINNKILFNVIVRIKTKNKPVIKYGEYFIKKDSTIADLIKDIINNNIYYRTITFAEGLSNDSILKMIDTNEYLSGKIPDSIPEGSLLPQTYKFQRGDTKEDLVKRMQNDMLKVIDRYWDSRDKDLPFNTKREALILASIVEKETGIEEERRLVASVFVNRLRIRMPLQSDPTAIYGYTFGNVAREKDIKTYFLIRRDSPYNTYKIRGLPPGPICNPGEESIKAVLNPAKTKYLFFVATGNGGHNFSETYFEHRKMVNDFKNVVRGLK